MLKIFIFFIGILLSVPFNVLAQEKTASRTAQAPIKGTSADSLISGTVTLTETEEGLLFEAQLSSVPNPGKHGFHIHQNGSCEENGNAAGGHFNPDNVAHGHLLNNGFSGAHAGDLGNIEIDENGQGNYSAVLPGLTLTQEGSYGVLGRAIILHEKEDDFGQPTGNAGGRIGCGVINLIE